MSALSTAILDDEITIAELAALTGVAEATLRIWENRHGIPQPRRLPNGHRRYSRREGDLIRAAIAHRRAGLSVAAALERARTASAPAAQSVFAALCVERPDLVPQAMERSALALVSRAIEDECLARAVPGLLIGAFQRVAFYRRAKPRWRELAAGMELTIVLADFSGSRSSGQARVRRLHEISLPQDSPLLREWALIAPAGCVLARERTGSTNRGGVRIFDAIWSPEPEVVYAAARIAISILGDDLLADRARAALGSPPAPSSPELRRAAALTNRIVGYVAPALV